MGQEEPMPPAQETRHLARLRVEIRGRDSRGFPFKQDAYTRDVSRRGVRLDGAPLVIEPCSTVEVRHRGRRSRFRVVWVGFGTEVHAQAGLQSLEPERCIWGLPLPGTPVTSRPAATGSR
jgi:hypothetical protein